MKAFLGVIGVLVLIALVGGGCVMRGYNEAMTLDANVKQNWSEVENQLQRRFDLIPQLVETVKGVAGQEQKVFLGIAEAQKAYFQAGSVAQKAEAASDLQGALSRLLLLQQQYPQLKSNENFLKLQDSIEGTENRLSVARNHYNGAVQQLDVFMRQFPSSFYASLAGVEHPAYFKVTNEEAKTAPKIDFSGKS
ncbi:MAG TPA: LemA family protein [Pirellulales bacterium]|nr:LemA family protein [Pirellulales bacterium]